MIPTSTGTSTARLSARHTELLDALEELVRGEGFGELGVGEIARRLRCSRSTLYAIAPSKEQLFVLLVDRVARRVERAAVAAAERERTPTAQLEAYLAAALEQFGGVGIPFLVEIQAHPAAHARLLACQHTVVSQLRALIEVGIEAGDFHPVNAALVAELLDAAATRIQDPRVLAETGLSASEALANLFRVITHGLKK